MRIIPVIDLQGGVVVRGVAGERSSYRPVQSIFAADAQPETVARGLVDRFGFREAYVADLDAIQGGEPNWPALRAIAGAGLKLAVDAGVGSAARAAGLVAVATHENWLEGVIVGLESLLGPQSLAECFATLGSRLAVFSLDLKRGRPLTGIPSWQAHTPGELAALAVGVGYSRLILLDLARVGLGEGSGLEELCRSLRRDHPNVELLTGGGLRGPADWQLLQQAGCDGVLVASALHNGRVTRSELR